MPRGETAMSNSLWDTLTVSGLFPDESAGRRKPFQQHARRGGRLLLLLRFPDFTIAAFLSFGHRTLPSLRSVHDLMAPQAAALKDRLIVCETEFKWISS